MRTSFLTMLLLTVPLTGCSTISVKTDYDRSVDFQGLRSFAWMPNTGPKITGNKDSVESIDRRIRQALENELAARGFVVTDAGSADFWINYQAALQRKTHVSSVSDYSAGPGMGWNYRYGREDAHNVPHDRVYVNEYDEGTLIVDVVDPASKKLMWRGFAQARIGENESSERRDRRVKEAVKKMLDRFPPEYTK